MSEAFGKTRAEIEGMTDEAIAGLFRTAREQAEAMYKEIASGRGSGGGSAFNDGENPLQAMLATGKYPSFESTNAMKNELPTYWANLTLERKRAEYERDKAEFERNWAKAQAEGKK